MIIPSGLSIVQALTPESTLVSGSMLLLLASAWRRQANSRGAAEGAERTHRMAWVAVGLCLLVEILVVQAWVSKAPGTADQRIVADTFRWMVDTFVLAGTAASLLLITADHARSRAHSPEDPVLLLLSAAGMMLLAAAGELMLIFLGIELMSLALYVLAGSNRRSARGAEAAMKYFVFGAFSTAFLLYGMALLYGATASTRLTDIASWVSTHPALSPMFLVGTGLLIVGMAFKVALAPFHLWAPDAYDGAPLPVAAFMSTVAKIAGFAVVARVMTQALAGAIGYWHAPVWWLAVLSMVVGNVMALAQRNVVRMLAYSSIAHSGYMMVAIAVNSSVGDAALLFYAASYLLATVGIFAVLVVVNDGKDRALALDDLDGLWHVRPDMAVVLAVNLLALLGMPLVGGMGFFAKWYVLRAAMQADQPQTILAVLLLLSSAVSAAYYLTVIAAMFMRPRAIGAAVPAAPPTLRALFVLTTGIVLVLGVYPTPLSRLTEHGSLPPLPVPTEIRVVPAASSTP